jgi:hypothetical protein
MIESAVLRCRASVPNAPSMTKKADSLSARIVEQSTAIAEDAAHP